MDPSTDRLRILVLSDYYVPGYRGGGLVTSLHRLVKSLSDRHDFFVFTRDRDLGDTKPYPDQPISAWFEREGHNVYYAAPSQLGKSSIARAIKEVRPHLIYLNSYFSSLSRGALLLRRMGQTGAIPFLIAPRGEFSPGALRLKGGKKTLYLAVARALGMHRGVFWQVSSPLEKQEAITATHEQEECFLVGPDLLDAEELRSVGASKPKKIPGEATFVFVSRISPKKNLLGAIHLLEPLTGDIRLNVFGPAEDEAYLRECRSAAQKVSAEVVFKGPLPPNNLREELGTQQFFLFPTLGENFGHVIPEAMAAGCPVLISDGTPWQDLEGHRAGWVIPLENLAEWRETLQACVDMDDEEYRRWSCGTRDYILRYAANAEDLEANDRVFRMAAGII